MRGSTTTYSEPTDSAAMLVTGYPWTDPSRISGIKDARQSFTVQYYLQAWESYVFNRFFLNTKNDKIYIKRVFICFFINPYRSILFSALPKTFIIEICLLKYYFKKHLICKWRYYIQTIFNQLNIIVPYVDIIGICHIVAILWEIHVMRHKYHVRWLHFHFERMVITGLGQ